MDGESKNQIKIKINGEEKNFKEDLIIHDWKTKREVAVTEERVIPLLKSKKKKRLALENGKNHPAIVISFISAIFIGILIGIMLLQLMTKDSSKNGQEDTAVSGNSSTISGNEQVILPAVSLYVLQQGVYKNQESVNQIVQAYKEKKQPVASINTGDNIRVFVAVTDSLETGKQMRKTEFYKTAFTDTWPTKLEMKEKVIQHLTKDEQVFLESAYSIYEKIIGAGTKIYLQNGATINGDELANEIEKLKNYKDIQKKPIRELQNNLLQAYEAISVFQKETNNVNWQKLQQYVLAFVSNYYLL